MKAIRSLIFVAALALLLPAAPNGQLQAQDCATAQTCEFLTCRTPARPVPSTLWGELRPAETAIPAERDSTDHNGKSMTYDNVNPFWFTVDPENGWLFTAVTAGFEIWDARTTPDRPAKISGIDGRHRGFPQFPANPEIKFPVSDIDAPEGDDTIVAVTGVGGVGLSIWNTTDKNNPRALYQDYGSNRDFVEVYAAKIGGVKWAFGATAAGGLRMYSMSQAAALSQTCLDASPDTACGVYKGIVGTRTNVTYVSGEGNLVALSSGTFKRGVEVWNLSNPNVPILGGTFGDGDYSFGHAMWSENNGASHYLAIRAGSPEVLKIYDVSCAATGSCVPGQSPIATKTLNAPSAGRLFVTFSRSGATPFLFLGAEQQCTGSERSEWVLDVSNPAAPRDITPPDGVADGYATGYWQWYARKTATGFNSVGAFRAKFYGEYLYRAAFGILDVHKLGTAKPNPAFTWAPSQIFVGTPVAFTDQSTGTPTSWAWSFPDASPASTFVQNPANVTYASTGTKSVTLDACNLYGCTQLTKNLTVYAPEAAVTAVSVSPATLTSCVTATFTASGVSGKAPLTYSWTVGPPAATAPTPLACTGATCSWVVPADWVDGTYEVVVKVTNAENPTGATASKQFLLDQQALGFVSAAPTSDPTTTGTVQFHTQTTGAKEWAWDFGTGSYGAWSADPVTGPNPTHTYLVSGLYNIKVKIRDCAGVELESSVLSLNVTAIPLVADFSASCFSGFCAFDSGMPITFTDASTGSPETWAYDWTHTGTSAGNCLFGTPGTSPQTSHTYSSAGTFQPCLRVTRGPDTSIFVHSKAIAIATAQPPRISISGGSSGTTNTPVSFFASATNCSPSPSGWSWSTGGGSGSSTSSSISITWSTPGTKTVSASNSACSGTSGFKAVSISSGTTGSTLTANYNYSPTQISAGQSVTFDGRASSGSPTIYQWTFGDGTGTADGSVVTHSFSNGGQFQVTLSIAKPGTGTGCSLGYCTDTETKTITVSGEPIIPLVAAYTYSPTKINAGKVVTFDGSSSQGTPTVYEWTFGDGSAKATGAQVQHTFAEAGTYQVKLSAAKPGSGTGCSLGFCVDEEVKSIVVEKANTGLCDDNPAALCLNKGRFEVKTEWTKPDGVTTGVGKPVGITDDTGYFWFEYASNVEIVAKVLDGCGVNGNFWVFAAGLTNIEVKMTVTDKETGAVKVYTNTQGEAFAPIQDTKAFSCAAAKVATESFELPSFAKPTEWVEVAEGEPVPQGVPLIRTSHEELAANATCVPDATTLCLNKDRFRVEAWWQTNDGLGTGQAVALGGDTGYFWFFNKENVELIIKVLDGCALNSRYWVFAGGLTNVGVRIIVTDMSTGISKEYLNPLGEAFRPYQDTNAISECF